MIKTYCANEGFCKTIFYKKNMKLKFVKRYQKMINKFLKKKNNKMAQALIFVGIFEKNLMIH